MRLRNHDAMRRGRGRQGSHAGPARGGRGLVRRRDGPERDRGEGCQEAHPLGARPYVRRDRGLGAALVHRADLGRTDRRTHEDPESQYDRVGRIRGGGREVSFRHHLRGLPGRGHRPFRQHHEGQTERGERGGRPQGGRPLPGGIGGLHHGQGHPRQDDRGYPEGVRLPRRIRLPERCRDRRLHRKMD